MGRFFLRWYGIANMFFNLVLTITTIEVYLLNGSMLCSTKVWRGELYNSEAAGGALRQGDHGSRDRETMGVVTFTGNRRPTFRAFG
jgi:hypothetical protein